MSYNRWAKIKLFRIMLIVSLALSSIYRFTSWAIAQGNSPQPHQVQTIYTSEFGVQHPKGMAFMPDEQTFYVWGDDRESATITLNGDQGNVVDLSEMIEDPLDIAFDPHSDSFFFLKGAGTELVKLGREEIGLPKSALQAPTRFDVKAFDLQNARGMTFDPDTGRLFILEAGKQQILIVSPHALMGFDGESTLQNSRIHRLNLSSITQAVLRGIAFNPTNGNLYIGSPNEEKIYELTEKGTVLSVFDTSSFLLRDPSAMLFAPSSDPTDDPLEESLYLVDRGNREAGQSRTSHIPHYGKFLSTQSTAGTGPGQILELSLVEPLGLPSGTTLLPTTLVNIIDASNEEWNPSSPDTSGIDYWPLTGRLLISDSEVDELPNYFTGDNLYDATTSGTLVSTCSTTNLSRTGFSNEPTGLAINPNNNRIYITDDDANKLFEVSLGPDGIYCTADDGLTTVNIGSVYNIQDGEDVAYGNNTVFIAGGSAAEVYKFSLGLNGVLGGGDDGPMTHFDTYALGFGDLEGIGYNRDNNRLFIVSARAGDSYLGEITTTGTLVNVYNLGNFSITHREDVTYAPSSGNPAIKNIYITDRGDDNNSEPQENDGKIWEISLGNSGSTATPTRTPTNTPTATATFTNTPTYTVSPPSNKAPSDFDGDGKTDPAKFYPGTGTVWWLQSSSGAWDGRFLGSDIFTYVSDSDFDGDGKTDPAKFYPGTGTVWWLKSSTGAWDGRFLGSDTYTYVPGSDFDGDGKTDPAKFYPGTGTVWWLKSTTGAWDGRYLGSDTFTNISGSDFDGDGKTDPAKFYPGTGTVWWLKSSTGAWDSRFLGSDTFTYVSSSDFDGDGKTDPAKFYPGTGMVWWLKSSTGVWDGRFLGSDAYTYVSGSDFDGDGRADPAKFYPGTGTIWWLKSSTGAWDGRFLGSDTYQLVN